METKDHKRARKQNLKYDYMEKCTIRETRNKPYQIIAAEKQRERYEAKKTTNENKETE